MQFLLTFYIPYRTLSVINYFITNSYSVSTFLYFLSFLRLSCFYFSCVCLLCLYRTDKRDSRHAAGAAAGRVGLHPAPPQLRAIRYLLLTAWWWRGHRPGERLHSCPQTFFLKITFSTSRNIHIPSSRTFQKIPNLSRTSPRTFQSSIPKISRKF